MRLHIPISLRWGDLDAFNHVNNTAMLRLLEEARIRALWAADDDESVPSTAVLTPGVDSTILTLIARQEIEYLAPVPYQRDPLDIQLWFGSLGGSSVEICYEVRSPRVDDVAEQQLYARATVVVVKVDASTGRAVRLSDAEREAWMPYLGEPIEFTRRR